MVESDSRMVFISDKPVEGATPALDGPYFIIKSENKYYVALATWEFDPQAAEQSKDEELIAGVANIRDLYEQAQGPAASTMAVSADLESPPETAQAKLAAKPAGGATLGGHTK